MEDSIYALKPDFVLHGDKGKDYYNFRFLNKGGYGITYLANATFYDGNIKQTGTYAIKEYFPSDIAQRNSDGSVSACPGKQKEFDESFLEFEQEGEMLHRISHHGIVPVNEVVPTNGTIYYVMSYLGETSLKKYVHENGGRLSEAETRRVAADLIDAVAHLHAKYLNHLDIKPENVMMEQRPDGMLHPVLIDFGLAKHFKSSGKQTSRLGGKGVTDGYSPLEQYAGISKFSPQADIYALGATLFYMLTGQAPLKAKEVSEEWIRKNLPSGISPEMGTAICRAMEKDRVKRTATVNAFFPKSGTRRLDDPDKPTPNGMGRYKYIAMGVAVAIVLIFVVMFGRKCGKEPDSSSVTNQTTTTISTTNEDEGATKDSTATVEQPTEPETGEIAGTATAGPTTNTQQNNSATTASGGNSTEANHPEVKPQGNSQTTPTATTLVAETSTGTKNLGYAIYEGDLVNGKPDGSGTLTFQSDHSIDSRASDKVASAGDVVKGRFKGGHLVMGTWKKTSGETERVMIGE